MTNCFVRRHITTIPQTYHCNMVTRFRFYKPDKTPRLLQLRRNRPASIECNNVLRNTSSMLLQDNYHHATAVSNVQC